VRFFTVESVQFDLIRYVATPSANHFLELYGIRNDTMSIEEDGKLTCGDQDSNLLLSIPCRLMEDGSMP
jgi:hypothetical protein